MSSLKLSQIALQMFNNSPTALVRGRRFLVSLSRLAGAETTAAWLPDVSVGDPAVDPILARDPPPPQPPHHPTSYVSHACCVQQRKKREAQTR